MAAMFAFFLGITSKLSYWGVFLLMSVESSFIPFPSEVVIPPAAYLAFQGEMNIFLVVLFGVLGSLFGASINYFLARCFGRVIVYKLASTKLAKLLFLNEKNILKSENYFRKYGSFSTFLGRLLPAVRQLISLPAGFSRMSYSSFLFFTSLGAGLWVIVLAVLGYYFGANQDLFEKYYSEITIFVVFAVIFAILLLLLLKRRKSR
jgi:membrane protein DedA with SNARE-associated domain